MILICRSLPKVASLRIGNLGLNDLNPFRIHKQFGKIFINTGLQTGDNLRTKNKTVSTVFPPPPNSVPEKPLKRLAILAFFNTRLKPGANEISTAEISAAFLTFGTISALE